MKLYTYEDILKVIAKVKRPIKQAMLYRHIADHELLKKYPPVVGGGKHKSKVLDKKGAVGITHYILTEVNELRVSKESVGSLFD